MRAVFERLVALDSEQAYSELKNQLFKQNSKLVIDEPSKHLVIEQGSLSGMTPKGIKKRVEYYFHPQGDHTRVVAKSSLSPDWVKLNVATYVVAVGIVGLLLFLSSDLAASVVLNRSSFLAIILQTAGTPGSAQTLMLANLFQWLAMGFSALILVSVIVDLLAYKKKYGLVEETLRMLP